MQMEAKNASHKVVITSPAVNGGFIFPRHAACFLAMQFIKRNAMDRQITAPLKATSAKPFGPSFLIMLPSLKTIKSNTIFTIVLKRCNLTRRCCALKSEGFVSAWMDMISSLSIPNVELTGAARLYRAASSDRRERG